MAAHRGRRPFLQTAGELGPFCLVRLRASGRAFARSVMQLPLDLSLVDGVEVIRDLPHVFDREIPAAPDTQIAPVQRNSVAQCFDPIWHAEDDTGAILPAG